MKALVVDDDIAARIFLRKLLKDKFNFEVIEAVNGIEAIEKVKENLPDFAFIDMSMPYLSGLEFLKIIRGNKKFRSLPTIAFSAIKNKEIIETLIDLGIKDYIVKPLDYQNTYIRLKNILETYEIDKKEEQELSTDKKIKKLLIADADLYFRKFISTHYSKMYEIIECCDGAQALSDVLKYKPDIVLVGENLDFLDEVQLVNKIFECYGSNSVKVFLCINKFSVKTLPDGLFDGLIKKTFDKETFDKEFTSKLTGKKWQKKSILSFLESQIKNDAIQTIKQVFNSMVKSKISIVDRAELPTGIDEVSLQTNFIEDGYNIKMKLMISGCEKCVMKMENQITSELLGISKEKATEKIIENNDEIKYEIFKDLLDVLAGRLCSLLKTHGLNLKHLGIEHVDNTTFEFYRNKAKILLPILIDEKEYFLICIDLLDD